jgi:hypothetical protein
LVLPVEAEATRDLREEQEEKVLQVPFKEQRRQKHEGAE